MKKSMDKISNSIIPVLLLFSMLFIILLFIQFKASENADKAKYIHITAETSLDEADEDETNSVVETDFSDDARIQKAQEFVDKEMFQKAQNIYFKILATEPSAQIHNWLGTLYLKQKKYNQAAVSFTNALELNPRYFRARYNRALAYTDLGETSKAINDYKQVISGFNSHVKSNFNLALLLYKNGDFLTAAKQFEKTSSMSSGNIKVKSLYLLGKCYTKIKPLDVEMAKGAFERTIRLKPNHIPSRLALIDLKYKGDTKNYKKKMDELEKLLRLESENLSIHRALSDTYKALGNNDMAIQSLEDALLQQPNNIDLRFELTELLIESKKYQEAATSAKNILLLEPSGSKANFLLGLIYYKDGDYDSSLLAYNKVANLDKSPILFYNMGLLYTKMKNYKDAELSYKKALDLKSDYPEAYYNLGLLALKQNKLDRAKTLFEKAISMKENYKQALYNLALVFTRTNLDEEAVIIYEKLLDIAPKDTRVKLNLAVRYSKMKLYEKAQNIYEDILKEDDTYFTPWLNLGLVYYQQKEYEQSKDALQRAVALEPDNEKANRALAKSFRALKNHNKAIEILEILLDKNPSDVKTRLAYARSYYSAHKYDVAQNEYNKVLKLDPDNKVAKKMISRIQTKTRK